MIRDEDLKELLHSLRVIAPELQPLREAIHDTRGTLIKLTSRIEVVEKEVVQLRADQKEALERETGHIKGQLDDVKTSVGVLAAKLDGNGEDPILVRVRSHDKRIEELEEARKADEARKVEALQKSQDADTKKAAEDRRDNLKIWAATITGGLGFLAVVVKSVLEYLAP